MKRTVHGKGRRAQVLDPFHLDEHTWFYAEATKFIFVREVLRRDGEFFRTEQIKIPTHVLRKALALLEKAK